MENIEQATAAPGEQRTVKWLCNKPLQPVCYERYENRDGQTFFELVSPLCPLVWGHGGPCRDGE